MRFVMTIVIALVTCSIAQPAAASADSLPANRLSGRATDPDRVRSFARGADDHLNKPTCHSFSAL
jgi:DNA-binding response OmpR family regulator